MFLLNIDDEVGAQKLCHLQPGPVLRRAGNDNERSSRLCGYDSLGKTVLAGALNQDARFVTDSAVEQRPLDAVRHWRDEARQLRSDTLGNLVDYGVPGKIYVLRKAAPK